MDFNAVWLRHALERVALVSRLPALSLFPSFRKARLDGLLLISVATRRLVAIGAVQTQATAQLGNLGLEPLGFCHKLLDNRFERFDVVGKVCHTPSLAFLARG